MLFSVRIVDREAYVISSFQFREGIKINLCSLRKVVQEKNGRISGKVLENERGFFFFIPLIFVLLERWKKGRREEREEGKGRWKEKRKGREEGREGRRKGREGSRDGGKEVGREVEL